MPWWTDPFTVGSFVSEQHHRDSDGHISAILVLILLMGFALALSLAHWVHLSDKIYGISGVSLNLVLIVYMVQAMTMVFLLWHNSRRLNLFTKRPRTSMPITCMGRSVVCKILSGIRNTIVFYPSVVGLVVFYSIAFCLHASILYYFIPCFHAYSDSPNPVTCATVIVYDVVHPLFLGFLLAFCVKFHDSVPVRRPLVRYGLLVITAGGLLEWLDNVLNSPFYDDGDRNNCFGACVEATRVGNVTLNKIGQLLYPLHTQFMTMSLKILVQLYFSCQSVESIARMLHQFSPTLTYSSSVESTARAVDRTPAHRGLLSNSDIDDDGDVMTTTYRCSHSWLVPLSSKKVCIPLILVVHVAWVITQVLMNGRWSILLTILFITVAIMISLLGFYSASKLGVQYKSYSALEVVIVMTSIGEIANAVLILVVGVQLNRGDPVLLGFLPALSMCACTLVYLQTGFMFRASRISHLSSPVALNGQSVDYAAVFYNVVLFLFVNNLTLWAYMTYFMDWTRLNDDYWSIISHVIRPLFLFYRFNSALLFLGIYLNSVQSIQL